MKNSFYLFAFALLSTAVFAQQKPVATSIDKNKNKIGAEFKVTYKTSVDTPKWFSRTSGISVRSKSSSRIQLIRSKTAGVTNLQSTDSRNSTAEIHHSRH
jgi:hypothetical protein